MIRKIDLGNNSFFIGEHFQTGDGFRIGKNNTIRARSFIAGENVRIGDNNTLLVGKEFSIGACGSIGNNNDLTGISISFGTYLFMDSNVIIGHGGKMNYDSTLVVGDHCMLCAFCKLNINYRIEIGDDVGIGEYVDVWTHGSYPPVLEGYPAQFSRVKIGNNVWLPAKSTVMPGVEIGDNVVIGANSVINKSLPAGSLCAGIPVKVIRENFFPKPLDNDSRISMLKQALSEYDRLLEFKQLDKFYEFDYEQVIINVGEAVFNFDEMTVEGELDDKGEDLRDYLRRRGMKFFTGKPFRSITPPIYLDLLEIE